MAEDLAHTYVVDELGTKARQGGELDAGTRVGTTMSRQAEPRANMPYLVS